jgi:glycosyltransferase involved in cell wall biosynthesis
VCRDTILYVGNFGIPNRNAAGSRVLANGYILREMGYNVIFIGTSGKKAVRVPISETYEIHHGFESFKFPYLKQGLDSIQYLKLFTEFITLIKDKGLENRIKAIIFYGSPTVSPWVSKVVNWCKKSEILAIEDCVDWLEINHGSMIFRLLKRLDYSYRKVYLNKQMDGVICISKFLEDYYSSKGKKTVLIPPLTLENTKTFNSNARNDDILRIVYAGVPFPVGRLKKREHAKDRLDLAIKYLYLSYKEGINFQFNIYGITKEQYLNGLPEDEYMLNEMREVINFNGYQKAEIIDEKVSDADFTILIRDTNRGTNAGFSTKFVQSISCGTPVITTNTSDIAKYMKENIYGFILDDNYQTAVEKLKIILSLPSSEIISMKKQCRDAGLFFYKNYKSEMNEFLSALETKQKRNI